MSDESIPVPARARREKIRDQVLSDGSVEIEDLARLFAVSPMTVHRDLDRLASQGWLRKVRGGATAEPSAVFESNASFRFTQQSAAKRAIAAAALEHVERGQALMLDDSTSALHLAKLLPGHGPLTVITNFLAVINELVGEPDVAVRALGGDYHPAYDAFHGVATYEAIRPLRADLLCMSVSAVIDDYCYHQSQEVVQVKRAMVESAQRRILLLDHTKLTKRALNQLVPLSVYDLVIVDADTDPAAVARLREAGLTVQVAERAGADRT